MAPRRGGGSGGYSSGTTCPNFLGGDQLSIASYVDDALFVFFFLCVTIFSCSLRKKMNPKKLTGPLFYVSLLCQALGFALLLIAVTLIGCNVDYGVATYYNLQIAYGIFFNIGNYLLLVIVVFEVNTLLVGMYGSNQSFVKNTTIVIIGIMGALTAAVIGISSYITAGQSSLSYRYRGFERIRHLNLIYKRYLLVYWVLYLLSVVAAGGLAIATIIKTRSRNILVGDIFMWTATLFVCMVLFVVFQLIPVAASVDSNLYARITPETVVALGYLSNFFMLFSYIALVFLSKSRAWGLGNATQTTYSNIEYGAPANIFPQQQHAHNGQPVQEYYYEQKPGAPELVHKDGHNMTVR